MFPFGHVGLTIATAELVRSRSALVRGLDYRILAVGAMLPDIIDKPLGHVFTDLGNGRLIAHSLVFFLALAGVAMWTTRRGSRSAPAIVALAFGTGAHLAFDEMWRMPFSFWWPTFGFMFPALGFAPSRWITTILTDRFVQVTEILGFLSLVLTGIRASKRGDQWLPARLHRR